MVRKRALHAVMASIMVVVSVILAQSPARAAGEIYGPYWLLDMSSKKCLADPGTSMSDNTTMVIWDCLGLDDQKWNNETPVSNSDYWTFNAASRKCLTVKNAVTTNNAAIIQYTCNTGTNERWTYEWHSLGGGLIPITVAGRGYFIDGYYKIKNLKSGRCLTVKNQGKTNGSALLQYDCDSPGSNMWAQLEIY
ncbi:RICIN domain-containing protein [Actinoplanes sp. CA-030573]|uniref:RICIN domain-containing protein n=1 Tax=Actinoplanes sp. CA-030573 TaxID=3239898 RepID=UPI003D89D1EC